MTTKKFKWGLFGVLMILAWVLGSAIQPAFPHKCNEEIEITP